MLTARISIGECSLSAVARRCVSGVVPISIILFFVYFFVRLACFLLFLETKTEKCVETTEKDVTGNHIVAVSLVTAYVYNPTRKELYGFWLSENVFH